MWANQEESNRTGNASSSTKRCDRHQVAWVGIAFFISNLQQDLQQCNGLQSIYFIFKETQEDIRCRLFEALRFNFFENIDVKVTLIRGCSLGSKKNVHCGLSSQDFLAFLGHTGKINKSDTDTGSINMYINGIFIEIYFWIIYDLGEASLQKYMFVSWFGYICLCWLVHYIKYSLFVTTFGHR